MLEKLTPSATLGSGTSPWLDESFAPAEALAGELRTDVAVVGAGFAGLSSALALRREGFEVAVLESGLAGGGASGRNAGHLTPTIGKDLPTLARTWGRERTAALVALADTAVGHVEKLIEEHGIECDYEPVGNAIAAVHPSQHRAIERAAEVASAHGLPGEILEGPELEARGLPAGFTRALLEPHGGILDPGRYGRGLRAAAIASGARLFERTPVLSIDEGAGVALRTPAGRVRARHAVLATNAWTPDLGRLRRSGTRLHVQLLRTEPLSAAQRRAVGWPGRQGIYTAHEILESWRWTADGRILGGSKAVRMARGGRWLADLDEGVAGLLERTFRRRFPQLGDLRIERHWGGPIFMALDFLPWVGRRGDVLHAVAWAGHGIAQASLAGEMVTDLLLGRDGPGSALWTRRHLPTPPDPLRWIVGRGLVRFFEALDRRADSR